jgi:hypothetical protein
MQVTTMSGREMRITSREFREYAEAIFREQNELATELAFRLDDEEGFDSPSYLRLEAAEDDLLRACSELNDAAARQRDGDARGPFARLGVARSVAACERASDDVRGMLTAQP